jgi:DNA-binding NarL/FixJ family response regulator
VRKVSSAAAIANYGDTASVFAGAIRHVLGHRSVVLKFMPPSLALDRCDEVDCDIAVLDWQTGFENARMIIARWKAAAPDGVVVVWGRAPIRRDQALQAGADVCASGSDFGSLCQALVKAMRTRR